MTLQSIAEVLCEQLTLDIKVDTVNVQRTAQAMRRRFRPYRPDEAVMMLRVPKSILPGDHQAFFAIELVNKHLDLSEILFSYNTGETRGRPPYDPMMMLTLLVYNYLTECESTRKIEEATFDVLPCLMIMGDGRPALRPRYNQRLSPKAFASTVQAFRAKREIGGGCQFDHFEARCHRRVEVQGKRLKA